MKNKPVIAIPVGDPASIGPEIVLKTLHYPEVYDICRPVIVGTETLLQRTLQFLDISLKLNPVSSIAQCTFEFGTADVYETGSIDVTQLKMGTVQDFCGQAAYDYYTTAIKLALKGDVDGIATATINKESLKRAGIDHIGHTEILEHLTTSHDPLTMFQVENLRIFFLSRHVSLRTAIDMVKKERVYSYIVRCSNALKRLGVSDIHLAVAGLNPHSSDNGMFGTEEHDEIIPAIEKAQNEGYTVSGPVPADSVFHQAAEGRFSAVLALYHDQGHIASKMYDFHKTVSVTLGAPFIRTSVDHGTAFDIAGQGIANEESMLQAVLAAAQYIPKYKTTI